MGMIGMLKGALPTCMPEVTHQGQHALTDVLHTHHAGMSKFQPFMYAPALVYVHLKLCTSNVSMSCRADAAKNGHSHHSRVANAYSHHAAVTHVIISGQDA